MFTFDHSLARSTPEEEISQERSVKVNIYYMNPTDKGD